MIPKIIHYCWFGEKQIPKTDKICIQSWKQKFPDWEFKLWNESNFTEQNEFLETMKILNKWGLYSEYVRFWALKKYGGIYFDTDVEVLKDFKYLLSNDYFLGFEKPGQVNIAVIGSIRNHPFNSIMLEYYENFKLNDEVKWSVNITGPKIRNFIDIDNKNEIIEFMSNSFIYPVDFFYPLPYEKADFLDKMSFVTSRSLAIHYWNATWVDAWSLLWAGRKKTGWALIFKSIIRNPFQNREFYKNLFYHLVKRK